MKLFESLRVAFSGLLSNRLRSLLTMLGIIIGVASVVTLVSIGQSFQEFTNRQLSSLGSNLIIVIPNRPSGLNAKTIKAKPLTLNDAEAMANPLLVPGLEAVAPQYLVGIKAVFGANSLDAQVTGTTVSWVQANTYQLRDGRFFEESDVTTASRVAVLGAWTARELFEEGVDPLGQDVRVNNVPFRVIGLLEAKGTRSQDELFIVPITTALNRFGGQNARTTNGEYRVSVIMAKGVEGGDSQAIKTQIENLLRDRHKVQFKGEEDFLIVTQDQIMEIVGNITGLITTFLALIAGISLVVGGIGIMNIMLVTVTERTKEIGLRKAVGAQYSDLMLQFLIESTTLSLTGGLIGLLLGAGAAFLASQAIPQLTMTITPPAVIMAVGVSTAIGLFFGVYPASRAASLDPIEALRYE